MSEEPEPATPFDGLTDEPPPKKKAKRAKKPTPPPIPREMLKHDDDEPDPEISKLRLLIRQYQKNVALGPALKGRVDFNVSRLSKPKLKERLQEIELVLGTHSNAGAINTMVKQGLFTLESLVTYKWKYDIRGTTNALFEDEQFMFLLERAKFKHNLTWAPDIDPALEMVFLAYNTMMVCHAANERKNIKPTVDMSATIPAKAVQ